MFCGRLHAGQIEAEPFAGDLKAPADHPGDRAGTGHAFTPVRIVILAAMRLAYEIDDVAVTVREIFDQPLAKQILKLEWQPQQDIAGMPDTRLRHRLEH